MTAQEKPNSSLSQLLGTFNEWLKQRRELNELRQLDRNEFDRIAGDLRMTSDDLDELVRHGPHAADELPKLLKVLGIDESSLASAEPALLRDMERVCAMCQHKRQCDHDLAAGTAAEHYREYCFNAPTIDQFSKATEPA